jgi:hypothetical protein
MSFPRDSAGIAVSGMTCFLIGFTQLSAMPFWLWPNNQQPLQVRSMNPKNRAGVRPG